MGGTIPRGCVAALEKAGHPEDAASIVTWQQERGWGGWVGNMAVLKETTSLHSRPPTPMLNAHCCLPAAAQSHSSNSKQSPAVLQTRKTTAAFYVKTRGALVRAFVLTTSSVCPKRRLRNICQPNDSAVFHSYDRQKKKIIQITFDMRFSTHMTVTPDPNFRNEKSQRNVSCTPQKGCVPKQCNGP